MPGPCGHFLYPMCGCAARPQPAWATHVDDADPRMDGWFSALTGIGNSQYDKRLSHSFQGATLSYQQIADLWQRDDIAAKAIEAPTTEAFREGYELEISDEGSYDDLKEQVHSRLLDLEVDKAIEKAYQYRRAYGGAAVLLGVNDGKPLQAPLDLNNVRSLDYLNVFEPIEIMPAALYSDPRKPKFGQPQWFQLNTYGGLGPLYSGVLPPGMTPDLPPAQTLWIHESRLIVFQGIKASRFFLPQNTDISPFWGYSIMPRFVDTLRDVGVSYASAGLIMTDYGQPVVSIDGLKEMVAKHEDRLRKRWNAINLGKSTARAILLDAKSEKYERQATQVSGLAELLDRLSQRLAAAVDIPLSVLFGYSPASLGSPDNKEIELWYNQIRRVQRRELTPAIRLVITLIMRTLRQRKIPKHWEVHWRDLEHMTSAQRAERDLAVARTDSLNVKSGLIWPNEVRMSRWKGGYSQETQIDEGKPAPGFIAPLPKGVLPDASPAEKVITAVEAEEAGNAGAGGAAGGGAAVPVTGAGAVGPTAHTVGGYVRRNPTQAGTEPSPKVGGDVARADAYEPGQVITFAGLKVLVENPKGSTRRWVDPNDGTEGETKMLYDYGEVVDSLGSDGDPVDCYLGPDENAAWVYVVRQMKAPDFTVFDENKCLIGFPNAGAATKAYLGQYSHEGFFGGLTQMRIADFREKVAEGAGAIDFDDE